MSRENATGNNPTTKKRTKPLTVMQWNAEGLSKKKIPLAERLRRENVDVACIQETHLTDNLRFTIRGYQPPIRLDRQNRNK